MVIAGARKTLFHKKEKALQGFLILIKLFLFYAFLTFL
ncbi:hypothetical protein SAMN05443663_103147 [Flavobacterium defluvii]|uniref:Uncharacterized protein n=1 Tax=Flavobacterium defluvii TaxID=370979 RepID=A0A1M5KQM3_9FLAO|nr:hypothetical protein SAMN05443663_103147 [Flavobacterium defluvii]